MVEFAEELSPTKIRIFEVSYFFLKNTYISSSCAKFHVFMMCFSKWKVKILQNYRFWTKKQVSLWGLAGPTSSYFLAIYLFFSFKYILGELFAENSVFWRRIARGSNGQPLENDLKTVRHWVTLEILGRKTYETPCNNPNWFSDYSLMHPHPCRKLNICRLAFKCGWEVRVHYYCYWRKNNKFIDLSI
jgi:hypothetical protein